MNEQNLPTFTEAMAAKRDERASEVGRHTWKESVERYGLPYLFAEMASIMSRLEAMIWWPGLEAINKADTKRLEDLVVDLGNYTGFLYDAINLLKLEEAADGSGVPSEEIVDLWKHGTWNS